MSLNHNNHSRIACSQRASQIRSMPFTGDSSDSSDGEDGHGNASQENTLRGKFSVNRT